MKNIFLIMVNSESRLGFTRTLIDAFMFVLKMSISVGTTVIAIVMMNTNLVPAGREIRQPFYPCLVIFCFSYIIASLFMGLIGAGVTTILHCYLIEQDPRSDPVKRDYHTDELLEFINKIHFDASKLKTSGIHEALLEGYELK